MSKTYMIGKTISMDAETYNKFVTLPKDEQIQKVYNMLSPKSMEQAEELLKKVPHGNINSGNGKETGKAKASNSATNIEANNEKPATDKG